MLQKGPQISRIVVFGALVVGFIAGCLVMSLGNSRPDFLGSTTPLVQREEVSSAGRDTVSYYSIQTEWHQVIDRAKRELPTAMEHDTVVSGFKAKVLTVPRFENGRLQMFYPPKEEITFMPRRLVLNHNGKVVALSSEDTPWTGIQLRVFRKPQPYDEVVEWIHKKLKV